MEESLENFEERCRHSDNNVRKKGERPEDIRSARLRLVYYAGGCRLTQYGF